MSSRKLFLFLICSVILVCCQSPTTDEFETGSLIIRAYSKLFSDPSEISAESSINAILNVEYPDGQTKVIVTDELGFYDFGTVKTGIYKITPRYIHNCSTTEIVVEKDSKVSKTILLPIVEIAYYVINSKVDPVTDQILREAIVKSIDREEIIASSGTTSSSLYSLIPSQFVGNWSSSSLSFEESLSKAQALFGNSSASIEIVYNNNVERNQLIADKVKAQWNAISGNLSVTLNGISWDNFVQIRDGDKAFQIARGGWGFESNNPLSVFKAQNSIDSIEYTDLLLEAEDNLHSGKITEFEKNIVDLNNYIIINSLLIPFYENN